MAEAIAAGDHQPRSRTADWVAIAALFVLITVVFSDVWFRGTCFFVRDLTRYYFPTKRILHAIVRAGEFPLWNRFYSAGQPLAANPEYEVFYPGQWPIFLRDYYLGFRLQILLHFYVAGVAMYSLMRSLGARVLAALITAVGFVFGGPLLSLVNLLPTFFCMSWLPLTFLFSRRYILGRRLSDLGWASLFFGIQTLAFEPAVLIETALLVVAYALWRGGNARQRTSNVLLMAIVLACGSAIGAAQIVATVSHLRDTPRAQGLTFDAVAFWSMPPARIGELLQPRLFGRNPFLSDDYWGGSAYRQASTPYLQALYLGYLALVAVMTGAFRRDRRTLAAVAAACLVWLMAAGENTPLLRLAFDSHLPVPLRFPERFAMFAAFALTIAAGLVVDRIISDFAFRRTAARVAAALAVLCVAISLFTFSSAYAQLFATSWNATGLPIVRHWVALSRIDWLLTAARALALAIVLIAARKMPPRIVGAVLAVFVAADLLQFTGEIVPRESRRFFETPPVARELQQPARAYRIFFEPEWSSGATSRQYFANAPTRFWTIRNGMFPRLPAAFGFSTVFERDIDLTNLATTDELTNAMWRVRRSGRTDWAEAFGAMSNVGYRAAYRPFQQEELRHPDPKDIEPITFVPVGPNPRYYFADEIIPVSSTEDFIRRMIGERHSVRAAYVPMTQFAPSPGSIRRISESSNDAILDVDATGRALLVCSVSWHRNWRATVDGLPAMIYRTNVAYQGIVIPPGRHRVVLRYRDPAVVAGGAITLLALIACTVVLMPRSRRFTASSAL